MKTKYYYIVGYALMLMMGLSSCFKEDVVLTEDSFVYNRPVNFAAPIVRSYIQAKQLLEQMEGDTIINVDDDGLLYVDFNSPFNYTWDDVISFPRIELNESYSLTGGLKSTAVIQLVDSMPLNVLPIQRFDDAKFAKGNLSINIPAVNGVSADYSLVFTGLKTAAGDFVEFGGNLNTTLNETISLVGSEAVFVHNASKTISALEFRIDMADPIFESIDPGTEFNVNLVIDELVPEIITGFFGTVYPLNQEFTIDFGFNDAFNLAEKVQFKGISLELNMTNTFGVPVDVQLKDMFLIKSETGEALELLFGDNNTLSLEGADYADPIVPKDEYLKIDNTNSNIEDAINFFPDRLKFDVVAKANPDGEIPDKINFLQEINEFDGNLRLYFPFWFKADNYQRADTIDFDFTSLISSEEGSIDPIELIDNVTLIIQTRNGMPFNIDYQIYPMTESLEIVDSLFPEPETLLLAPPVDSEGKVDTTSIEMNEFKLELTKEQIQLYADEEVKSFLLKSSVSTGADEAEFVQFHDFNFIELKLMVDIRSSNN